MEYRGTVTACSKVFFDKLHPGEHPRKNIAFRVGCFHLKVVKPGQGSRFTGQEIFFAIIFRPSSAGMVTSVSLIFKTAATSLFGTPTTTLTGSIFSAIGPPDRLWLQNLLCRLSVHSIYRELARVFQCVRAPGQPRFFGLQDPLPFF